MKTASTNKKIREIIQLVNDGKIVPRPEFQRRLVWTRDDKNLFIDSILRGYPFPEIYLADGEVDLEAGTGTQLLVDGLQRVNTLIQYFKGDSDLKLVSVPPYKDLTDDNKKAFLQYDVSVRDLGAVPRELVVEVFKRINATKYSLLDIEINNAVYTGALKRFAERVADDEFFSSHAIFTATDYKRMGDLRFALGIVITMIAGYGNRDDDFEAMLSRYNDEFPIENDLAVRIRKVFDYIDECGFESKDRVWRKSDLFSFIVEIDDLISKRKLVLQPLETVERCQAFFKLIAGDLAGHTIAGAYYKAALQASNDRLNRVRRGVIISGVILGIDYDQIAQELTDQGLN